MIAAVAKAPHIDWSALSPIVALFGGATLVLLLGLLPALRALHPGTARSDRDARRRARARDLAVGHQGRSRVGGAADRRPRARADGPDLHRRHRHGAAVVACRGAGRGRPRRVLRAPADVD